jgi:putative Mg2+ transporter-C (MgtC) family protein
MGIETWLPRLLFSALFGGIVGLERQFHGRPAGLRTHMLVSIGSALMTLAGIETASMFSEGLRFDGGRIAAGVITGIGFLGAGAIVRTKDFVRGVTTAACIWFAAGTGIASGLGMIPECAFSTALVVVILTAFGFAEEWIPSQSYRDLVVTSRGVPFRDLSSRCIEVFRKLGMKIQDIEIETGPDEGRARFIYHLRIRGPARREDAVAELSGFAGIESVSWQEQRGEA